MTDSTPNVEEYSPTTFKGWTDGPKIVLDCKGIVGSVIKSAPDVMSIACETVGAAKAFLINYPYNVGTFYLVASVNMNEFQAIRDLRPSLDVRLLLTSRTYK